MIGTRNTSDIEKGETKMKRKMILPYADLFILIHGFDGMWVQIGQAGIVSG